MALDPQLLEILACPDDKGPLLYFEGEGALYNPRRAAPLSVIVGRDGRVVWSHEGFVSGDRDEVRAQIERALAVPR